jgi:DNA-binding CsgD family transcriptional regulator
MPAVEALESGRTSAARGAWRDAYDALTRADGESPLQAPDVELLATTAYMLGRDEEYYDDLERAHRLHLDAGERLQAARCAFWIGMHLAVGGQMGRATGWLGRAQRLVEREDVDCVERGYMLMPLAFQREAMGDFDGGARAAAEAAGIAERFADDDLFAMAVHVQGHFLVKGGHVAEGLSLFDEAMVAVTAGELSPMVSGIVYCGVILGCQTAYEPRRAQEWTAALARWCERQPEMVAFSGRCHVHRAEIMQLKGAWSDALEEARFAARRAAQGNHRKALAEAAYVQGEVHRLRGELAAAEDAYGEASRHGREPQPGLALLRLAQGKPDAALAAITRALGEAADPVDRARLLPAYAGVMLAAGDVEAAGRACDDLAEIARGHEAGVLGAVVAQTRGVVRLAEGDATGALVELRAAWRVWEDVDAPYEAARVRVSMGEACRALGDDDAAALELDAARRAFAEVGAAPDVARLDALSGAGAHSDAGLTARELQVLRMLADGRTNKAIAAQLVLSERTVDRHVSNLFAKLGVSSRAAATAYAYEHHLI